MVRKALNPQPSVSQSVNNQGGHRAARAAKKLTRKIENNKITKGITGRVISNRAI